jgi:hypothetical protein
MPTIVTPIVVTFEHDVRPTILSLIQTCQYRNPQSIFLVTRIVGGNVSDQMLNSIYVFIMS